MNVTLTPALEKRVQEKIEREDYDNTDALIQEAFTASLKKTS